MVMKVNFRKNDKINPRVFKEGVVRVGFFEGIRYDEKRSVAQVAKWNEYGVPKNIGSKIPARPFMRPAVFEKKQEYEALLRSEYKKAIKDKKNTMVVLRKFGEMVVEAIKDQIRNGNYAPNAPATIKAKGGRSKPLIDTKLMLNSVDYKAEEVKGL